MPPFVKLSKKTDFRYSVGTVIDRPLDFRRSYNLRFAIIFTGLTVRRNAVPCIAMLRKYRASDTHALLFSPKHLKIMHKISMCGFF